MTLCRCLAVTATFALGCSTPVFAQYPHIQIAPSPAAAAERGGTVIAPELAADLLSRIQKSGADVGVAFRTLDGRAEWFSRPDDVLHAAITMKVPVMMELFHQVNQGKIKLDDPLTVKNEFHSLVDGSIFTLDRTDDSAANLYKAIVQTLT